MCSSWGWTCFNVSVTSSVTSTTAFWKWNWSLARFQNETPGNTFKRFGTAINCLFASSLSRFLGLFCFVFSSELKSNRNSSYSSYLHYRLLEPLTIIEMQTSSTSNWTEVFILIFGLIDFSTKRMSKVEWLYGSTGPHLYHRILSLGSFTRNCRRRVKTVIEWWRVLLKLNESKQIAWDFFSRAMERNLLRKNHVALEKTPARYRPQGDDQDFAWPINCIRSQNPTNEWKSSQKKTKIFVLNPNPCVVVWRRLSFG